MDYSGRESEDRFIEYKEDKGVDKTIIGKKEAEVFISSFLIKSKRTCEDIRARENKDIMAELIRELKIKSNLSVRYCRYFRNWQE
jgi:hypothetical protein